jgi:hypothetical protein
MQGMISQLSADDHTAQYCILMYPVCTWTGGTLSQQIKIYTRNIPTDKQEAFLEALKETLQLDLRQEWHAEVAYSVYEHFL